MKNNGIRRVYYSLDDGTIQYEKLSEIIQHHISHGTSKSICNMTKKNIYIIFGAHIISDEIAKNRYLFDNG